jgi:hypothetical protein
MARLEAAEARVRKLEAEAEMQGKIVHALMDETGTTAEQFKRAALRACGLPVDFV